MERLPRLMAMKSHGGTNHPGQVAALGFHLDDVGPLVGQDACGHGARDHGREVNDLDAFERCLHDCLLVHRHVTVTDRGR